MHATRLLVLSGAAALIAGAALAHGHGRAYNGPAHVNPSAPDRYERARSASEAGVPSSAMIYNAGPGDEMYRHISGDPIVITNGPVPDTPRNRARFGGPMSHGGRATAPVGN